MEIERIFGKNLLTRKDIISTVEGLWELIIEHDQRCSYKKIRKLIDESGKTKKGDLSGKVAELIEYDKIIRELVVKKGQLDPELLDFLFGRPLSVTIETLCRNFLNPLHLNLNPFSSKSLRQASATFSSYRIPLFFEICSRAPSSPSSCL